MDTRSTSRRIRGWVVPLRKNHRGRILAMGLRTRDDEAFEVSDTPLADMLRDFLGEEIVAHCVLVQGGHPARTVRLVGFAPIPPPGTRGAWLGDLEPDPDEDPL